MLVCQYTVTYILGKRYYSLGPDSIKGGFICSIKFEKIKKILQSFQFLIILLSEEKLLIWTLSNRHFSSDDTVVVINMLKS